MLKQKTETFLQENQIVRLGNDPMGLLSKSYTTDNSSMSLNNRQTPTKIPVTNKTSSPQTQCHDYNT